LSSLDLNLLEPLSVLLSERHVTRAAVRCSVAQPSMSRLLGRLREHFGDDLIVRARGGYERTARGEELLAALHYLLPRLEAAISEANFDPRQCRECFRIATTDYVGFVLLPEVLARLAAFAPNASITVTKWNEDFEDDLFAARLDTVIMPFVTPPRDLRSERLLDDRFVCFVASDHPLSDAPLTLAQYLSYKHVAIDVLSGMQPRADRALALRGTPRKIVYRTPFLASAIGALSGSQLILTVPERVSDLVLGIAAVRKIPAPTELGTFQYGLAWHRSLDVSAAQSWFRDQVRASAALLSPLAVQLLAIDETSTNAASASSSDVLPNIRSTPPPLKAIQ
jgi:DNA-binding transcriptional LysR family regulator